MLFVFKIEYFIILSYRRTTYLCKHPVRFLLTPLHRSESRFLIHMTIAFVFILCIRRIMLHCCHWCSLLSAFFMLSWVMIILILRVGDERRYKILVTEKAIVNSGPLQILVNWNSFLRSFGWSVKICSALSEVGTPTSAFRSRRATHFEWITDSLVARRRRPADEFSPQDSFTKTAAIRQWYLCLALPPLALSRRFPDIRTKGRRRWSVSGREAPDRESSIPTGASI
jgi:hypothetical protein